MRTILCRFYNEEYRDIAEISGPSAMRFAHRNGMTFLDQLILPQDGIPHMARVSKIMALLGAGFDRVVYSDADVVFTKEGRISFPPERDPIAISMDNHGLCTGFFYVNQDSIAWSVLQIWSILGVCKPFDVQSLDQGTLRLLADNFKWIGDRIHPISEGVISQPRSGQMGSVAHHWQIHERRVEEIIAMRKMASEEAP